jgi:hypothetical protein
LDWKRGRFTSPIRKLKGPAANRTEKNWIGFVHEGRLFFIYSMNPILILEADPESGETKHVSLDACLTVNSWRGSSTPVLLNDSAPLMKMLGTKIPKTKGETDPNQLDKDKWILLLVHMSDYPRYGHQFVVARLRPMANSTYRPFSFQILLQSKPFVFETHDVEFTCGMQFTPDAKELVIPYAKRDEYCQCIRVDAESVFKGLEWIGSPDDAFVK